MKSKTHLLILFSLLTVVLQSLAGDKQLLTWQISYHQQQNEKPAKWLPSTVPGAVQLDVMLGENYKQPYWYANNYQQFFWMESWYFTYKTSFKIPILKEGQQLYFVSKGIDYEFVISLNGEKLFAQEGMFTPVNLNLTEKLKENNELTITLMPIPTAPGIMQRPGYKYRDNAERSVKPPVSWGWDWHPRLVTRGIWDETYLEVREASHLKFAAVDYDLNTSLTSAKVKINIEGENLKGTFYKWTLKDPQGKTVLFNSGAIEADNNIFTDSLKNIALWWPNGYGKQNLYASSLELLDKNKQLLEKREAKVGFKTVKLIMSEGGWIEPILFPKSRSVAPANFEINGKRIFAKGSNWVNPETFPGIMTKETYETQIKFAKEANFNMFRVWGGGITNKESFFELCDEYGILVWQEFPLACNMYPDDEHYLTILEQEARSIIKRVKPHVSLALWCGGNELFNEWSMMTDQSHPLRLLNKLCYELDRKIPYLPTSPVFGMGHGHYVFYDAKNGGEVFQWMPKANNTAYPEFGMPGVANIDVLKAAIPAEELFPPKLGTAWETHHAFKAWGANRWLEMPFLEDYFGKINTLEDLVAYSQLTQCEGYKCIFEEARRQKPYCGMAINWCYQEPWPCAVNNSLINYPSKPKPALYHVGKACRPVLASARIPKFRWDEGETFSCDLFILNDTYDKIPAAIVTAKLVYDDTKEITFLKWDFPGTDEAKNYAGPTARVPLPKMKNNLFKLVIEVAGKPEYKSEYTFIYRGTDVVNAKPKIKYMNGITE